MIDKSWFFNEWSDLARVVVLGAVGYAALVVMLRVSRKRTLAQMNVFDFVYIVVMGELLAMTIMDHDIPLAQGLVALVVLIGLQALISWLTTKSKRVERVINGEPTLLFHRGRFLHDAMSAQRVTEAEVLAAAREEGVANLDEVEAVVLETSGEFSVLHDGAPPRHSTLYDVHNAPRSEKRGDQARERARGSREYEESASR